MLSNEAKRLKNIILDKAREYGFAKLEKEIDVTRTQLSYLLSDNCTARCRKTLKKVAQYIGCMDFYTLFLLEI